MIRVSASYPNTETGRFDLNYYTEKHLPMLRGLLGDAAPRIEIFRGVGSVGGGPAAFQVIAHLHFESMESFSAALAAHGEKIFADIPNYTDIEPVIQIEEAI
jgi:uncharacterized protein (TIGR02118 family)